MEAALVGVPSTVAVFAFGRIAKQYLDDDGEDSVTGFLPALYRYAEQIGASKSQIGTYKHVVKVTACGVLSTIYTVFAIESVLNKGSGVFGKDALPTAVDTIAFTFGALSFVLAGILLRMERWQGRHMRTEIRLYFCLSFCCASLAFAGSGAALLLRCLVVGAHLVLAACGAIWSSDISEQLECALRADIDLSRVCQGLGTAATENSASAQRPLLGDRDQAAEALLRKKRKKRKFKARLSQEYSDQSDTSLRPLSSWDSFRDDQQVVNVCTSLPNIVQRDNFEQQGMALDLGSQSATARPRVASDPFQATEWDGYDSSDVEGDYNADVLEQGTSEEEEEHKQEEDRQSRACSADNEEEDDEEDDDDYVYDTEEHGRAREAALAVLVALANNPDLAADHRRWLIFNYEKCLRGHRLIQILLESGKAADKKQGLQLAKSMIKFGLIIRLNKRRKTFRGQDELVRLSENLIEES